MSPCTPAEELQLLRVLCSTYIQHCWALAYGDVSPDARHALLTAGDDLNTHLMLHDVAMGRDPHTVRRVEQA